MLTEDAEARIFEIISYAILKNHYKNIKAYFGSVSYTHLGDPRSFSEKARHDLPGYVPLENGGFLLLEQIADFRQKFDILRNRSRLSGFFFLGFLFRGKAIKGFQDQEQGEKMCIRDRNVPAVPPPTMTKSK